MPELSPHGILWTPSTLGVLSRSFVRGYNYIRDQRMSQEK